MCEINIFRSYTATLKCWEVEVNWSWVDVILTTNSLNWFGENWRPVTTSTVKEMSMPRFGKKSCTSVRHWKSSSPHCQLHGEHIETSVLYIQHNNKCLYFSLDLSNVFSVDIKPLEVSREEFESACKHLVKSARKRTLAVLEAKTQAKKVDKVLLVGGSSKLPMIKRMLGEIFPLSKLNESIDAYEAIAKGAAIRGVQLSSHQEV